MNDSLSKLYWTYLSVFLINSYFLNTNIHKFEGIQKNILISQIYIIYSLFFV